MMKKIKYCMLTTVSATMESFALPTVMYLSRNGYEITLIANMTKEFLDKGPKDFNYINLDIERGFKIKNTILTIISLMKIFKEQDFDVIEYAAENISFCAALAGKVTKIPIRIYSHWGSRYVAFKGIKRSLMKLIERCIALNSTNIRQVSFENTEICFKDHVYKKGMDVKVLGKGGTIGVDLNVFDLNKKNIYSEQICKELKIPLNTFIIGDVGHVRRDKGSNELLYAFKRVSTKYKNMILLIIGDIYDEDPLDCSLMKWAKKQSNIIFTGKVDDVYRYMACMNMFVHPSYREGFGMVLQEASAFAVPIITTNIPGPREFIDDGINGYLVPPKDGDALAKKIEKLYNENELQKEFGKRSYEMVVRYFDRNKMLKRILEDRNNIINSKGIGKI